MKKREVSLLANSGHNSALNHVKSSVTFWELGREKRLSLCKKSIMHITSTAVAVEKKGHTKDCQWKKLALDNNR